ncbi:RNAPII degradation factor [Taxawa tesnikishii (nom. ined.)]|nr:RNAPII degradation factor [Dothideales sp. JES 119]
MSEIDTRSAPSRGRSTTRGGRGGFGRGGPRGGHRQTNGAAKDSAQMDDFDQGELGDLKKKYSSQLSMLKEMFPDWSDMDLLLGLQDTDGDLQTTIDRIAEGHVSQFSDVKSTKDRARSKAKDASSVPGADQSLRGGRGRGGYDSARGGRGTRGTDRGRGGFRGARGGHAPSNGAPKDTAPVSVPTTESSAWDTPATTETTSSAWDTAAAPAAAEKTEETGEWGSVVTAESTPAAASEGAKSSLIPEGGAKKTWASMFAKPKAPPVPAVPKQAAVPPLVPAELKAPSPPAAPEEPPAAVEEIETVRENVPEEIKEPEPLPPPAPTLEEPTKQPEPSLEAPPEETAKTPTSATEGAEEQLAPSNVPLTEDNLEHLPDVSHPQRL